MADAGPQDGAAPDVESSNNASESPLHPDQETATASGPDVQASAAPQAALLTTVAWKPDGVMLQSLLDVMISFNAAVKALHATGNMSVDAAMCWICEHLEDADLHELPMIPGFSDSGPAAAGASAAPVAEAYKMVIVVNMSLKMGTGKIASQTGHVVLALYRALLDMGAAMADWLVFWEATGTRKIAVPVKAQDTAALQALQTKAQQLRLPSMLISDAGRTQVAPGSITTLAVFGPSSEVDKVTGDLKLL